SPDLTPHSSPRGIRSAIDGARLQSGSTHIMRIARWMLGTAVALAAVLPGRLTAQGLTTGALAGRVTDDAGQPLSAVQIVVRNRSTGFTVGAQTREDGRY